MATTGDFITVTNVSPTISINSNTGEMILKTALNPNGTVINLSGLKASTPFYIHNKTRNKNVISVDGGVVIDTSYVSNGKEYTSDVYINDLLFSNTWIKNNSTDSITICSSNTPWNSPSFSMYPQVTNDTNSGYVIIRGGGSKVPDASYNTIHTKTNFPDTYSLKGNFSLYKQHRFVISNAGSLYFETVYKKINNDTNADTESHSETSKHLVRSVNGKNASADGNVSLLMYPKYSSATSLTVTTTSSYKGIDYTTTSDGFIYVAFPGWDIKPYLSIDGKVFFNYSSGDLGEHQLIPMIFPVKKGTRVIARQYQFDHSCSIEGKFIPAY